MAPAPGMTPMMKPMIELRAKVPLTSAMARKLGMRVWIAEICFTVVLPLRCSMRVMTSPSP